MSVAHANLRAGSVTVTAPHHEEDLEWQEPVPAAATHALGMMGLPGGDRVWVEMAEIPDVQTEWRGVRSPARLRSMGPGGVGELGGWLGVLFAFPGDSSLAPNIILALSNVDGQPDVQECAQPEAWEARAA